MCILQLDRNSYPVYIYFFVLSLICIDNILSSTDLCLKWRILPFSANNIGKVFPDDWVCSMNPDPGHNRCSAGEQKMNIPEGQLKKEIKSSEQKEKDLANVS